jgi:glycosyltransferase involved in cell wall biosynthesis
MKIVYLVHQYFPRSVGGTEIYTRGLARRAAAAGHDVLVITCHENASGDPADFHLEETEHEGIAVVEIHSNLSVMDHPARAEYSNPVIGRAVARRLRDFKPDLAHVLHAMKLSASALEACLAARVPVVVTLCDFWFICPRHTLLKHDGTLCRGPNAWGKCVPCVQDLHSVAASPRTALELLPFARDVAAIAARPRFLRRALLNARRIIALSHFAKDAFVQNGFPAARIEVIPHGLEIEDLEIEDLEIEDLPTETFKADEGRAAARPLKIGFIGSLVSHKGAHLLLEALAAIPDMPVQCLIYGAWRDDEYCQRLRQLADDDARVQWMGSFAPEQMGRVLSTLDVLAMPSLWYENEPLVVKAALRLGLPVLANDIGSLLEMIESGRNGWLVESSTARSWAAAIAQLAAGPLPRFAPTRMKTMDENAEEMLQIYADVSRLS